MISRNLVSETHKISKPASGEDDNYASAFFIRYSPNDIVMNKAIGGYYHGFHVRHDNQLKLEVSLPDNTILFVIDVTQIFLLMAL